MRLLPVSPTCTICLVVISKQELQVIVDLYSSTVNNLSLSTLLNLSRNASKLVLTGITTNVRPTLRPVNNESQYRVSSVIHSTLTGTFSSASSTYDTIIVVTTTVSSSSGSSDSEFQSSNQSVTKTSLPSATISFSKEVSQSSEEVSQTSEEDEYCTYDGYPHFHKGEKKKQCHYKHYRHSSNDDDKDEYDDEDGYDEDDECDENDKYDEDDEYNEDDEEHNHASTIIKEKELKSTINNVKYLF